jgi:hypothetical protein
MRLASPVFCFQTPCQLRSTLIFSRAAGLRGCVLPQSAGLYKWLYVLVEPYSCIGFYKT